MDGAAWKAGIAGLLAAALGSAGCDGKAPETSGRGATGGKSAMAEATVELTDATFEEVTGKGVVLVDFWATWCPPCRAQGPIVAKLSARYAGRAVVGKVDVDANRDTAGKFSVQSIPTLIVFKDGKEFRKLIGLQAEEKLAAVLDEALGE